MKIEKDAEWNRLEAVVDEVEGRLAVIRTEARIARAALTAHSKRHISTTLGLVIGETIVTCKDGKYLVTDVQDCIYDPSIAGRKIRKDGTPGERETRVYGEWKKVEK